MQFINICAAYIYMHKPILVKFFAPLFFKKAAKIL